VNDRDRERLATRNAMPRPVDVHLSTHARTATSREPASSAARSIVQLPDTLPQLGRRGWRALCKIILEANTDPAAQHGPVFSDHKETPAPHVEHSKL
jgi:hypothetical protein